MRNNLIILDKRDTQIITMLDFDARMTLTELGRKTRLSKQAVDRRIKRLENEGIIQGYYAVIDIAKLGYTAYRVALKLKNFGKEDEKKLFEWCRTLRNIGWLFSVNGKWDVAVTVYAKDISELYDTHKRILESLGDNILLCNVSPAITIHNYPLKLLGAAQDIKTTGGKISTTQLDDIDRQLLKELGDSARLTLVALGKKLKQHPRTLHNRIKRLEKESIIKQYRAKINTSALGYDHYKVFLSLNLGNTTMEKIIAWISEHKNTVFTTEAIGLGDLEFESKVKNAEEVYTTIAALREAFPGAITSWDAVIIRKEQFINYYPFNDN